MAIVYSAADTEHRGERHNHMFGDSTLCGLPVGDTEFLALPVDCQTCRVVLGEINRKAR